MVVGVIVSQHLSSASPLAQTLACLSSTLAVIISGIAVGYAVGIAGGMQDPAAAAPPKVFIGMALMLIFVESLGFYGLIYGLKIILAKE